ncbi:MFS transporter [Rhodococcus erythropolis]|uniref:MFS transporter n=1 Tax=Rhodococcus erythropolis TaxID=1833 RepID=UPI0012913542|nr:MFS transporter [Rhodococcus erythropolis]MQP33232.1 MFS transporter [Rhodococcus erythropolis]
MSTETTVQTEPLWRDEEHRIKSGKTLRAATAGFFIDMYDVYLPVVALVPAIAYFAATDASSQQKATLAGAIFAVSLIGRPIGSIIFGYLGDRIGRRQATVYAAAGFTICTGLIAVLPGYSTIGGWAAVLLVLLRLVDGVFLGGEYSAANPLAMEYAPKSRRGMYGAIINAGYPAALGAITLVTMLTLMVFEAGDASAPYSVWGWRIPFAIGFVMSAYVFFHYLYSVPESEVWNVNETKGNPLKLLLAPKNRRAMFISFVTATGGYVAVNGAVGAYAAHFKHLEIATNTINTAMLISSVVAVVLFPLLGMAGQRYGRREMFVVLGLFNLIITPSALAVAILNPENATTVVVASVIAIVGAISVWSQITAYIMEMFPASVRSSGYGISYSLPSILPAFYPYIFIAFGLFMDYDLAPVLFVAIGGALLLIGSKISSDLRDVEM